MITRVEKGWGHEIIFANSPEYCGKLLVFKKDKRFSLHYHIKKDETWYVAEGRFECTLLDGEMGGAREFILEKGDSLHISRGMPHQLRALEDSTVFEVSTQHFDEDSYRIQKGD
jgi:mannose-6-phosphate isomerase-like protein (cupin superfamily)